jgi:branched-chain amino acid transport system substrate-binding protein
MTETETRGVTRSWVFRLCCSKLVDPGRFQPLSDDFGSQISAFKNAGVEIVIGVVIPPDFATFWNQAVQQGFKPKVVTTGWDCS